jgi:GNAT superfamily N-acetyltransferase
MKPVLAESAAQIATVALLAREIWPEHYVSLIGRDQVEYMLSNYQSAAAIGAQITEGIAYHLIELEGEEVGYFAIRAEPVTSGMFLSKLYLRRAVRGRGLARAVLRHVEALCRDRRLSHIWLTVHKRNPSVQAYERLGFSVTEPVVTDIGNGYVMDDYRMQKLL